MWQDGAYGEEATAKVLGELPAGQWTVLHDLANGRFNFDHVVIGPPGVFCLNSKFSAYRLQAAESGALVGVHVDDPTLTKRIDRDISGAKWEAVALRNQIEKRSGRKVWVQPVIVWWGPYPDGGRTVEGVAVVQGKELVTRISRLPSKPTTDLESVCEVLRPGRHRR
ncbi:hypothetical protein N869_10975 [Cellulomonas bogoriensis 69B4 = DSM 16987]|uniref:NERD domain-containing protein n=2 Tax=Cellulomonas bogoriensis TaxID=301388 RepID=A0A0A0C2M8_9CELL|nr:hypothetical protein N869_10975 [Cellulomonas bogoriensis 69B4 = DSM 16987]